MVSCQLGCGREIVQNFDVPVPQMMEQLPNIVQFFAALSLVPEQVVAVPKILPHDVPPRRLCRDTQLAEQLVEVPTKISFPLILVCHALMAQRTVEQNVDIPAVGGIGTGGGPSGFLPGQSSSVTAEQIVDIPVPRPDVAGDLQGFPRGQGSTAVSERIPEFPDPGGGREDFQPVQGSAASSSDLPGQAGQGVFRTFPQNQKSATQPPHSRSELLRTRAHGRRRLMTRPRCLRRRKRRRSARRTLRWSTWSTTGACGGASGFPLARCLAAADGSQVGHVIWRPPWLIGTGPG